MGINPGEQVNVGLSIEQQALLISKAIRDTTDNKMIVRENNKITIPTELRRSLNLNKGDKFQVLTLKDRMVIFRKKTGNL
ncbi:AbrB family looped-hinge helix DNA binding protein [Evansella vedderi]|uniref:AbrB family looped-hinge helix DNA binding protein n=2 Tax=Evansella vedderi TaxID=38282 RepID=A0ABT9ZYN7_9BACI|nr:AbrB/MazE/SpoVT family DNA-binding domain-containing protein [Evansella vedderi]MDQ0256366.1 AbrB family looped-hinge helix DNA binding protein [Evansella vedderi]